MVTLGSRVIGPFNGFVDMADKVATFWGTSFLSEWTDMQAGTFMHELGHNLGWTHQGPISVLGSDPLKKCLIVNLTT